MNNILVEIKDLYVEYQTDTEDVCALNGIDLVIHRGESLGIVGETGAGKTTLALSLLQLLPDRVGKVTKGSIHYDGMDVLKASKRELLAMRGAKVSMIFQDPMTALNPILTVGSQISEVLELHYPEMGHREREQQVDDIMEMVGIPKQRKGEFPHQFSGGMKQRIGIAMALVAEPELLLADEPTTALDVTIQAQILVLMKQLKEKFNSAMVLITHDLGVVAEFCENVAIIYAGEIIEHGSVEDVFSRKKNHPYTVGLFNSIPTITGDVDRLTPIPGTMADPTNLPKGCKFADRCPHAMERCHREVPPLYTDGTHSIKCFLFEKREGA
ncbi:MAG: ABC transporter ATP-binding protein [Christensenellales bacterium]|jgi:peptide/nickel transport system ATP-binding protein